MGERMTIGEFSSRCGLSAKVLRSYADLGVLMPTAVDPSSGYRYYESQQVGDAVVVALLRQAGIAVADIGRFLPHPAADVIDAWEQSLAVEVHLRREALSEVRRRLGMRPARGRGATVVEIRSVQHRSELQQVFDLVGRELLEPIDSTDSRFDDLDARFPADQPLMVVAVLDGEPVGGALAFRNADGVVTIRMIAVREAFRHRGIGRRLVERLEEEGRNLGVERFGVGTDEGVGFWFHMGYTANLLFQWAYDADACEDEMRALLEGPLQGLHHWRASFKDIPQLFVELDEPRIDLRQTAQELVTGCHVGFVMFKWLGTKAPAA